MITTGRKMPSFSLKDDQGIVRTPADFAGKTVVLYAYPKDSTPGCTIEACTLRDNQQEILDEGAIIVGISPDSVESHVRFRDKHELPFMLLSDPDKTLLSELGAWGEKVLYGKHVMGIIRSTFVIAPDGTIEKVWPRVTPLKHAQQIATYLRERKAQ